MISKSSSPGRAKVLQNFAVSRLNRLICWCCSSQVTRLLSAGGEGLLETNDSAAWNFAAFVKLGGATVVGMERAGGSARAFHQPE